MEAGLGPGAAMAATCTGEFFIELSRAELDRLRRGEEISGVRTVNFCGSAPNHMFIRIRLKDESGCRCQ